MGAGYHPPDGGDYYHHGAPGEFHVGPGLSQKVHGSGHTVGWAVRTKKGENIIYPYDEKRHKAGIKKNIKFRNYTGRFKDTNGNYIYVSKQNPAQYYTHAEHQEYVKSKKGGQKGRQGQQQPNQQRNKKNKQKKRKNEKIESVLIDMIQLFKAHVNESKSKSAQFPDIKTFDKPSIVDVGSAMSAFKQSFDTSKNDFLGRNPAKKWPEDLAEWEFPDRTGDINADYKNFYQHASKLTRGVAQLLISNNRYKASKGNANNLAHSIAKANDLVGENLNMETVVAMLAHKPMNLKLHNPQHIFAVLPKVASSLNYGASGTKPREFLAQLEKKPQVVDDVTYGLLIADELKLLKRILKRVKNIYKKTSEEEDEGSNNEHDTPPKTSASSAARGKLGTEYPGLVGMSSAHVY
jgi:hypothetical protein